MSFLTPLYLLGLAAIALPVLFHLVRRMPRGRQPFSSLMFLSASPPRLTRKSRLDNLLLLLLRATVLTLLVAAFARPFVRAIASLGVDRPPGRKIVVLIDTSASMRRGGLWEQAVAEANQVVDDLGPGDDAALLAFDANVRTLVAFNGADFIGSPAEKKAVLRDAVGQLAPGWYDTDLGLALTVAAEMAGEAGSGGVLSADAERLVVVISDLQEGARLDALNQYRWPDGVRLDTRTVLATAATDAGVHLAAAANAPDDGRTMRVRVTNNRNSRAEQFRLAWSAEGGVESGAAPIDVYVPAGESRVMTVPLPADMAKGRQLTLSGDEEPIGNMLYAVPLEQAEVGVLYLGNDKANDPSGLLYYLKRAFPETPGRRVIVRQHTPDTEPAALPFSRSDQPLIVVAASLSEKVAEQIRQYTTAGGTVLYVLREPADAATLARLFEREELQIDEAKGPDYAMLGEIDFAHPLFAPFADPRFGDFTKIHFWRHRSIRDPLESARVVARFDDGSPALLERPIGKGLLIVMTSGWHPADSELARSSKFVPLMAEILNLSGGRESPPPQYVVGDRVSVASAAFRVVKPDGTEIELPQTDSTTPTFNATDLPGVYRVLDGSNEQQFAVNVAPSEGRTEPRDPDELEQYGIVLGRRQSRAEIAEQERQMQDTEMENHQKLWQWFLAAALGVMIVEIGVGGYLARRTQPTA